MKYLPALVPASADLPFKFVHPDSCAFGCQHKKGFTLMYTGYDLTPIDRRCPGFQSHVVVQGSYTKASGGS